MAIGQLKQQRRIAELKTVYGIDVLTLVSFECDEGLSEDFDIRIEAISERDDFDFDQAIATHVTIKLFLATGAARFFDGLLTDARWLGHREGHYVYRLTLRPWFWLLTKTSNCRIFKDKTVPEIISAVVGAHDFANIEKRLTESYKPVHYCVQYRESDYAFCCRLMEEYGISYLFEHSDEKHVMILADAKSSYNPIPGGSDIPFIPLGGDSQRDREHIYQWVPARNFRTGKFAVNDYDFKKPSASLKAVEDAGSAYNAGALEQYDYPGRYTDVNDGTNFAKIRLEAEQAADHRVQSAGEAPRLAPGYLFSLVEHKHGQQNKEYLVVRASHSVIAEQYRTGGGSSHGEAYSGSYDVLAADRPYRTPAVTSKPRIPGPQTAVVVGNGEIDVDEYGQIMVAFHWDRDSVQSRRVRVAQIWSGKKWGGVVIPRVGQEVIVQFLEGDPDQPLVIGTVYNAERMPPYELPGAKNKAGVKSDSTMGGGGYNELVFDDTKSQELIGIHAQKDMESVVENDERLTVKHDRETSIGNDRTETVGRNTTETIGSTWLVEAGSKIKFVVGASKIEMTPGAIKIESPMIEIKAGGQLKASGIDVDVTGSAKLDLNGGVILIN